MQDEINKLIEECFEQENVDDSISLLAGKYLFYHSRIDNSLFKIIESLVPEVNFHKFKVESYSKKLLLLSSIAPLANEHKLFNHLHKINKFRNSFAHESERELNVTLVASELFSSLKQSFEICRRGKLNDEISKLDDYNKIVKVMEITSVMIKYLASAEALGRENDGKLHAFYTLKKLSSLIINRRFSSLLYMFQEGKTSSELPEEYKLEHEIEKLKKDHVKRDCPEFCVLRESSTT